MHDSPAAHGMGRVVIPSNAQYSLVMACHPQVVMTSVTILADTVICTIILLSVTMSLNRQYANFYTCEVLYY